MSIRKKLGLLVPACIVLFAGVVTYGFTVAFEAPQAANAAAGVESTATISTDKHKYVYGEQMVIKGSGFLPSRAITLTVVEPGGNVVDVPGVFTDEAGEFTAYYFVPGKPGAYRLFATDGTNTADTRAVDPPGDPYAGAVSIYKQCANDDGDGYDSGNTGCRWIAGNLNTNAATYVEGDATVQQAYIDDLAPGSTHMVTFQYNTTKGGKHAYDFLTTDIFSEGWISAADMCEEAVAAGFTSCASVAPNAFPIPWDPNVPAGLQDYIDPPPYAPGYTRRSGVMNIRNGTITAIGTPTVVSGSYLSDSETSITVSFTVASPCADPDKNGGCGVLITFGAHVSKKSQWVTYGGEAGAQTASSISGSPYHVALLALDGEAIGQRDNQMASNPIAKLHLEKFVDNTAGGSAVKTDWTLTASGPTNVSADGDTGELLVKAGNYTLAESGGPAGYTASNWLCSFNGGASTEVPSAAITLEIGDAAYCTITNTAIAPQLKLVKTVTNDNGGTAEPKDWTLTATGSGGFSDTGDSTTFHAVTAGVGYALSESGPSGYTAGSWSCDGGSLVDSTITLGLGDSVTCTINNNDVAPQLKLVKTVTNDNGGTAEPKDWTLTATGTGGFSDAGDSTTFHAVTAAVGYVLSESGPPGYTAGSWSCDGGSLVGSTITLGLGDSVTCTINNNDIAPQLTLVKQVINDSGGSADASAWTLSATADGGFSGTGSPATGTTATLGPNPVKAGVSYALSESGSPAGYSASAWVCVGGTQDGSNITLALGQSATCTITNDDQQATLTLVKTVINNNGGTLSANDFPRFIDGNSVSWGVAVPVSPGQHTASEIPQPGYTASAWGGDCAANGTVTIALGEAKTCTITNDDQPAQLTLVKQVINNHGGTAVATDFLLSASGPTPISGPGGVSSAVNAGTYTLTESQVAGYSTTGWVCVGGTQVSNTVALALGQSATCTITNDDLPSYIIVNKLSKDGTGTFEFDATGFTLPPISTTGFPNGTGTSGPIEVGAGAYTVGESSPPQGWKLDASFCSVNGTDPFGTPTVVNGVNVSWAFTLPLGTTITCTFDNSKVGQATRTQGFWSTHTGLSNTAWATEVPDLYKTLCTTPITANPSAGQNQLMGGFWANVAQMTTGKGKQGHREDIDQARMQMLQQYLAAVLNVFHLGSGSTGMLDSARTAYCGTDISAIKTQIGVLGDFNSSGDSALFTPGVSATAKESRTEANIAFWDSTLH